MHKLTPYDPANALLDDEEIAVFMADALETGDSAYIAKALGVTRYTVYNYLDKLNDKV